MEPTAARANRQIARAATVVMGAFVFSQLVGLLRDTLVTNAFGAGAEIDAFYAANRVSETLFNLVAGGALGSAFIPTFTALLTKNENARAWKLASSITNLVVVVLVLVSALAAVFAGPIVRDGLYLLAPDQNPVREALTISLLRIQLLSVTIFGVSGLVMGILNAHGSFLLPAIAPSMYSIGWIIGLALLGPRLGVAGLAWGAVLGAALHLLVQAPALLRLGGRYSVGFGLGMAEVRQVARLMGPRLFGAAAVQLNFIANTVIALSLPVGSNAAISLAFRLMYMPQAAIAQSAAIAALPTFSAQAAAGRLDEMRAALAATLRGVLLLSVPAAVGLVLLARPVTATVYQRGSFTPGDTQMVAWALAWYAAGLVGHCLVEVLARSFFALQDTRTPVLVGSAAMGLNILFSLGLARLFSSLGWLPHGGLALANSLATGLEALVLLALLARRLDGLRGRKVLDGLLRAGLAGLVMGGVVWAITTASAALPVGLVTLGGVLAGAVIYAAMLALLRVPELSGLAQMVLRRVRVKG